MREKGKKKARLPLDQRTVRQLTGNMSRAPSDLLVSDQEIQVGKRSEHTKKAPFGAL
jgi:hypothetical protein